MSYEWKCYMNEHVVLLMPKERWGKFDGKFAEFTEDIIKNEVRIFVSHDFNSILMVRKKMDLNYKRFIEFSKTFTSF